MLMYQFLLKNPVGIPEPQGGFVPGKRYEAINGSVSESDASGTQGVFLINFGRDFAVNTVTKEELAGFIRSYTDVTEKEPGLFVISEASKEMGLEHPEVTLDLR